MRSECEKQQKKSGTSGEEWGMKAKKPVSRVPLDPVCVRLQAEGVGTVGGAEEASLRRDRAPQKGD